MFRALLVDDEQPVLSALRHIIPWAEYGFSYIGTTTSSMEALTLLENEVFDVCFVDVRMPVMSGLEMIGCAKERGIHTLFVVLTAYPDFSLAKTAIRLGVVDYCLKTSANSEFIPVLESLAGHILEERIKYDPHRATEILADPNLCEKYLMASDAKDSVDEMSLMLFIRSEHLSSMLHEAMRLEATNFLVLNSKEALLVCPATYDKEVSMMEFCHEFASQALFICDIALNNGAVLQNIANSMRIACRTKNSDSTGLIRMIARENSPIFYLGHILAYVDANYAKPINLKAISQRFRVDYCYLSRIFKTSVGISFTEYLTKIRLERACDLLKDPTMSIAAVSETVGFSDYHYFCTIFKRYYSMTPSQYRSGILDNTDRAKGGIQSEIISEQHID